MSSAVAIDSEYFCIEKFQKKGRGLVAIRDIPKKTIIIQETALIKHQPHKGINDICHQLNNLNDHQKNLYFKLHHSNATKNEQHLITDIFQKNAINISDVTQYFALFPTVSFINHSCAPNSYWYTDGENIIVMTLKNVAKGTEITAQYIDPFEKHLTYEQRRSTLEKNWGFKCECDRCCIDDKRKKQQNTAMKLLTEYDLDANTFLILQLHEGETRERWQQIINISNKQREIIKTYFDNDIAGLWSVYWTLFIAQIRISEKKHKKKVIEEFQNIHFEFGVDLAAFCILFGADKYIKGFGKIRKKYGKFIQSKQWMLQWKIKKCLSLYG